LQRTQLDAIRTLCYSPGPLAPADISDYAAELNIDKIDSTAPSPPPAPAVVA
jgi:hypothetical protein